MTLNFMKIVQAITLGMSVAEKIKNASGKDKLDAVLASTPDAIQALELGVGKDVLNDAKVVEAETAAIAAIKNLSNVIDAVKQAKGTGDPT